MSSRESRDRYAHGPWPRRQSGPDALRGAPVDLSQPFGRLALVHVLSIGGDALVAMALAGSLFFSVDPSGARWRIFLYLLFAVAPFAVVGPLIGPMMDRAVGGRRMMLLVSAFGRLVVAVLMVSALASDSLWVFPEAFLMLILSKGYQVAKAALVPTVIDSEQVLVEANSKLQLLSGLGGFAVALPGLVLLLAGASAVMALAALVFACAGVAALRVPATTVAEEPATRRRHPSCGVARWSRRVRPWVLCEVSSGS
ncbi:MAG: hypothetical protein M5U19_08515 [Microthrixaceae bacterium]|nr:hypothetical protein [Microthrixaceae bacterium]